MKEYFFYVWFLIGFFHMFYLLFKIFPHFKKEFEHQFWLGFWVYNSNGLDAEGKKVRKILIIAMLVYFFGGVGLLRTIN